MVHPITLSPVDQYPSSLYLVQDNQGRPIMLLKWRTRTKHVNFENVLSNETIKRWFESCIRMYLQYHKHHFWQSKTSLFIKWLHTKLRKKTELNSDKKRVKTGCAKIPPAWRRSAALLTCVRACPHAALLLMQACTHAHLRTRPVPQRLHA